MSGNDGSGTRTRVLGTGTRTDGRNARRADRSWFIAGLNGTDQPLTLRLPLGGFRRHTRRVPIDGGEDPLTQLRATPVPALETRSHTVPLSRGSMLRLDDLPRVGAEPVE